MMMTRETSAAEMRDMPAVDARNVAAVAWPGARGDQTLQPTIGASGESIFNFDASVIRWNVWPRPRWWRTPSMARSQVHASA
jgi:hypothetical protein